MNVPNKKENKTKNITFRVSAEEYRQLQTNFRETTCRRFSDFIRKKLFSRTIIAAVRDRNMDDAMAAYAQIKKDFNGVANNFNQLVKKLHSATSATEFKLWASRAEARETEVVVAIRRMDGIIKKIMEKWLL